ncbi:nucleoside hydrolase [Actinotalea sp. M2MS4P-6]|uniref:nucleoside hydrolase n=1 Tax=Actinotalea sp. M2MS4P-6 TaxID=2983762 RepID=UPI0021E4A350|nr:nucleoside hydrolase [Actinotalea sp. M2MS4P-6]MCV2394444.1 nucleoside hydrolase [Actinotalea sp. M2MS4P-6]
MSRIRVISDNDYAGDPDGLVQLAHHALSGSVELVGVIGSHLAVGDPWNPDGRSAERGADAARRVLELAGRGDVPVVAGGERALADAATPRPSAAVDLILAEARRDDDRPLFVVCGAGLTEIASAFLLDPTIATRLTVVWIGGPEHPGLAVPPPRPDGPEVSEYNQRIDLAASRVVFGSTLPLWQVPRDAYRQALMSFAELDALVRPAGALGAHLVDALEQVRTMAGAAGLDIGETYILGDSPLVLLTALQSSFEADPSSSRYVTMPAPRIADDGSYRAEPSGRPIRVYTDLDVRLMFGDLVAKLAAHAGS